jgi:RNA-directed DNA polymerase
VKAPPLLLGYPSPQGILKNFGEAIPSRETLKFLALAERGYPPVTSVNSLAILFQYSPRFVVGMALKPNRYYRRFSISKGRKQRRIDAPRVALKAIQSWFGHHLARAVTYDECVHGFVPDRSIVTAAREHCGALWTLNLDIRDFFPSIDEGRVVELLSDLRYPAPAARLLARLFTLEGRLPQGAPTSPVLANLAFSGTDKRLAKISAQYGLKYTRYADDLIFSSKGTWPGKVLLEKISHAIHQEGWVIAKGKTRLSLAPRRMSVLGLVVNGETPRLPKSLRNQIRRMRFFLEKGYGSDVERERFRGYIAFSNSVTSVG